MKKLMFMSKKLFFCGCKIVSKYGFHKGHQRYKCASCGKIFKEGERLNSGDIWIAYVKGKQTYQQLSEKYNCSVKTIQLKIDEVKVQKDSTFTAVVNVLMDTTYFGRKLGVMVFKDSLTGQILYIQYVNQETNKLYLSVIEEIARRGIKIKAIICDGRKGLLQLFDGIPIQMCQFHQVAIVRRYLTKKPKMQASKELWEHVLLLTKTDKESFEAELAAWHTKWNTFLNERKIDTSNRREQVVHSGIYFPIGLMHI